MPSHEVDLGGLVAPLDSLKTACKNFGRLPGLCPTPVAMHRIAGKEPHAPKNISLEFDKSDDATRFVEMLKNTFNVTRAGGDKTKGTGQDGKTVIITLDNLRLLQQNKMNNLCVAQAMFKSMGLDIGDAISQAETIDRCGSTTSLKGPVGTVREEKKEFVPARRKHLEPMTQVLTNRETHLQFELRADTDGYT